MEPETLSCWAGQSSQAAESQRNKGKAISQALLPLPTEFTTSPNKDANLFLDKLENTNKNKSVFGNKEVVGRGHVVCFTHLFVHSSKLY